MYKVLDYFKYNAADYYAAVLAGVLLFVIFCIFLNVIQFETYNRMGICHPYFYQSDACRRLVASTLASNPRFSAMKNAFVQSVYDNQNSVSDKVATLAKNVNEQSSSLIGQINQVTTAFQNSPSLGNTSSFVSQVKSLIDATLIDPTMIRYVQPLQRLYQSMVRTSPDSASKGSS